MTRRRVALAIEALATADSPVTVFWISLHSGDPREHPGGGAPYARGARTPMPRGQDAAWRLAAADDGDAAPGTIENAIPVWCEVPPGGARFWAAWSSREGGTLWFFGPIERIDGNILPVGAMKIRMGARHDPMLPRRETETP